MKTLKLLLAAAASLSFATAAVAGPVLTELDSADYITVGGLDWAWAGPISSRFFDINELFQADLHAGWREASDAEWDARPDASAFGNRCASKYWNSIYTHCDNDDNVAQHWVDGDSNSSDLWYVRSAENGVPEPATLALVSLSLLGAGLARRSNKPRA